MIKTITLIVVFFASIYSAFSQMWRMLPNSPASVSFRHDDVYFIGEDTGWVCNVDGNIYRTTDAGATWVTQLSQPNTSFRCLGFVNSRKGWSGNLGPGRWSPTIDTVPLYETNDGGTTWNPAQNISGTLPKGICGINVIDDSVIYAVGRVGGPAYLLKTVNGGSSWVSIDMNSLAFQLIDCKFFNKDTGIVVGGYPGPTYANSIYRILYTTDGGNSWQIVTTGNDSSQNCWKIHFVNRLLGYVSVESDLHVDTLPVLKTMDGGLTWERKVYSIHPEKYVQGIGFINDSVGWAGSNKDDTKITVDGGATWTNTSVLYNFNRFRFIHKNLAYAVGNRVWKYSLFATGESEPTDHPPKGLLFSIYPNPFKENSTIVYHLPEAGEVLIRVYDFAGRPIKTIEEHYEPAGEHLLQLNLSYYFDTHFFVVLKFNQYQISRKILSVR
jgi:photosystem II stability/assembly factor-like uncharacterized protein